MKSFTSGTVQRNVPIEFDLEGKTYTFRPVKRSSGIMALLVDDTKSVTAELNRTAQILNWFTKGLDKDHAGKDKAKEHNSHTEGCQACDVLARLADEDDSLEFETVIEASTWLIGESTSRPTG